jgi:hypothetical protein
VFSRKTKNTTRKPAATRTSARTTVQTGTFDQPKRRSNPGTRKSRRKHRVASAWMARWLRRVSETGPAFTRFSSRWGSARAR